MSDVKEAAKFEAKAARLRQKILWTSKPWVKARLRNRAEELRRAALNKKAEGES